MRTTELALCTLILPLLAGMAWGNDYFLYSPAPVSKEQADSKGKEAVAVTEITVAKGDSLFRISRRFSGKGSYYPQILLFNEIKNPNLIHTGQLLRVPLPEGRKPHRNGQSSRHQKPAPLVAEQMTTPAEKTVPAVPSLKAAAPSPSMQTGQLESSALSPTTETEQALYAKGVKAYKSGNCTEVVAHFDRFLARYPESPMAADASLYRADCYLQQATE